MSNYHKVKQSFKLISTSALLIDERRDSPLNTQSNRREILGPPQEYSFIRSLSSP